MGADLKKKKNPYCKINSANGNDLLAGIVHCSLSSAGYGETASERERGGLPADYISADEESSFVTAHVRACENTSFDMHTHTYLSACILMNSYTGVRNIHLRLCDFNQD